MGNKGSSGGGGNPFAGVPIIGDFKPLQVATQAFTNPSVEGFVNLGVNAATFGTATTEGFDPSLGLGKAVGIDTEIKTDQFLGGGGPLGIITSPLGILGGGQEQQAPEDTNVGAVSPQQAAAPKPAAPTAAKAPSSPTIASSAPKPALAPAPSLASMPANVAPAVSASAPIESPKAPEAPKPPAQDYTLYYLAGGGGFVSISSLSCVCLLILAFFLLRSSK